MQRIITRIYDGPPAAWSADCSFSPTAVLAVDWLAKLARQRGLTLRPANVAAMAAEFPTDCRFDLSMIEVSSEFRSLAGVRCPYPVSGAGAGVRRPASGVRYPVSGSESGLMCLGRLIGDPTVVCYWT